MIDIGDDIMKARPERVTSRPLQQTLQWTAAVENRINQRITTFYKSYSLPPLWPDRLPP